MESRLAAAIALLAALVAPALRADAETATAVSVGGDHTCAVTSAGAAQCWGNNLFGQLGDDTTQDHSTPQDVFGLTAGIGAVAAGDYHSCAITAEGGVVCWGSNGSGRLGDGTTANSDTPVDVSGLGSGVAAVAAGAHHTCAVTTAGEVRCWGANESGQLGDGSTTASETPVEVVGLSDAIAVAVGGAHSCALTGAGGIKCWGDNAYGQLGNGTTVDVPIPVDVVGLSLGASALSAGNGHSCAITSAGALSCWGRNLNGQLGDDSTTNRSTPVGVSGLASGVTAVSAGFSHTCAIADAGVRCWGGNGLGQVGDGTTTSRDVPVDVVGATSGAIAISAGGGHSCAITNAGLLCWGGGQYGELGDGRSLINPVPDAVAGLAGAVAITAGPAHSCAIDGAGGVYCWGKNNHDGIPDTGPLGDGTTTNRNAPVPVVGLTSGATAVAAGEAHTCAITGAGGLQCWGNNAAGQLGNGTRTGTSAPVDVVGMTSGVAAVATGYAHTCAVTSAGALKCWGANTFGKLGDGTSTGTNVPVDVVGLASGVAAVAAGFQHTCALTSAGALSCWGRNEYGQLGDGSTLDHATPAAVAGLASGVADLLAGYFHSCALTSGGALSCFGRNFSGQIGDGTTTNRLTPVGVAGMGSGVLAVADTRGTHSCAIAAGGALRCWGSNAWGQVGDGTTTNRSTPVGVTGLASGVVAVAAGHDHSCAIASGGGVQCWGENRYGELGNGWDPSQETPVAVVPEPARLLSLAAGAALLGALARSPRRRR